MKFTPEHILAMENPHKDLCSGRDLEVLQENSKVLNSMKPEQQKAIAIKIVKNLSHHDANALLAPLNHFAIAQGFEKILADAAILACKIHSITEPENKICVTLLLNATSLFADNHPLEELKIHLLNEHGRSIQEMLEKHAMHKRMPELKEKLPKLFAGSTFANTYQPESEKTTGSSEKKGLTNSGALFFVPAVDAEDARLQRRRASLEEGEIVPLQQSDSQKEQTQDTVFSHSF